MFNGKITIFTSDAIKTFCQGAIGAMTFGAYHQYTTNKIMKMNNDAMDKKHNDAMEKLKMQHNTEMNELREQMKQLSNKKLFSFW